MKTNKYANELKTDTRILVFGFLTLIDFLITISLLGFAMKNGQNLLSVKRELIILGSVSAAFHIFLIAFSLYGVWYSKKIVSPEIRDRTNLAYLLNIYLWWTLIPSLFIIHAYNQSGGKKSTVNRAIREYHKNHIIEYLESDPVFKDVYTSDDELKNRINESKKLHKKNHISLEEQNSYIYELFSTRKIEFPIIDFSSSPEKAKEIVEIIETY